MLKGILLFLLLLVGCSDDLPSFSIDPEPDLPPLKLVVIKEGIGVVEADYGIDFSNITYDFVLYMSRDSVEDVLGEPVDSTTSSYTYKDNDITYIVYYDPSDRLSIMEVYGDRVVSLYNLIYNSVTTGQTRSDIEKVYGTPDFDGVTMTKYYDRGLGFLFDQITQKIEGMSVQAPVLEFTGGDGTKHVDLSMDKNDVEKVLGEPINVNGSIYTYEIGVYFYIIAYSGSNEVQEFIVSIYNTYPYALLYVKHNGKETFMGDTYSQMVSLWGTPDQLDGSVYFYYDEGIGFFMDGSEIIGLYCIDKSGRRGQQRRIRKKLGE